MATMASKAKRDDEIFVNNTTTLMVHDFMIIVATVMIWQGVSLACDDISIAIGLEKCKCYYLIWIGLGLLCMWVLLKQGIKKKQSSSTNDFE
jgi:hypothetical protein